MLDRIDLPGGSYLVIDRAYIDYGRLYSLSKRRINFVVRSKRDIACRVAGSRSAHKDAGIVSDDTIVMTGNITAKRYPDKLRMVIFHKETQRNFIFLTNNFKLSATTGAELYKSRWGIELFFKWIKQHLKVKSFRGQSENAVKTQIWIAISSYVIVSIARKRLELQHSLHEILQRISLAPFERTPIKNLFENVEYQDVKEQNYNQLKIF